MARVDANQTIVRQRAEIINHMETGGDLLWDIREHKKLGLEAHRTALRRYVKMVMDDTFHLRVLGFQTPQYAMPGLIVTGGVKITLSFLRNNDAHLWDDFIAARRKILAESQD